MIDSDLVGLDVDLLKEISPRYYKYMSYRIIDSNSSNNRDALFVR